MRSTSSPFDSDVVTVSATFVSAQSTPLLTQLPWQPSIPTTTIHDQATKVNLGVSTPPIRSDLVGGCAARGLISACAHRGQKKSESVSSKVTASN
eukprot:5519454-Amphidinium_carterae.1